MLGVYHATIYIYLPLYTVVLRPCLESASRSWSEDIFWVLLAGVLTLWIRQLSLSSYS